MYMARNVIGLMTPTVHMKTKTRQRKRQNAFLKTHVRHFKAFGPDICYIFGKQGVQGYKIKLFVLVNQTRLQSGNPKTPLELALFFPDIDQKQMINDKMVGMSKFL